MRYIYRTITAITFFTASNIALSASVYIGGAIGGNSNALGLAVDSSNGHYFVTTLSYQGQDNLYEFDSNGSVVNSTRVPYDTGSGGNLGPISIVGQNLFVYTAQYNSSSNSFINEIIEIDKSGTNVISSFNADNYGNGGSGLSYNQSTNQLYVSSFYSTKPELDTISLTGEPIDNQSFESVYDIAYDNQSNSIFGIKGNILTEFQNINNSYELLHTYDLASLGIAGGLAIDINQANGLLYIQNNNEYIIEVDKNQLTAVPLPPAMWLFTSALFGIFAFSAKRKSTLNKIL